jgi:hypothetical protein
MKVNWVSKGKLVASATEVAERSVEIVVRSAERRNLSAHRAEEPQQRFNCENRGTARAVRVSKALEKFEIESWTEDVSSAMLCW